MSGPGAEHEPRQTTTTGDYTPNPAKSIKVPESRQRLVQDVTDLYSCKPTHAKVSRYTPDAVYDDMYVPSSSSSSSPFCFFLLMLLLLIIVLMLMELDCVIGLVIVRIDTRLQLNGFACQSCSTRVRIRV